MKIIQNKFKTNHRNRQEYPIGSSFKIEHQKFTVVKYSNCINCCFIGTKNCKKMECVGSLREDSKSIMFIEI